MRIERFTIDVVDEDGKPATLQGRRRYVAYPTLDGKRNEAPGLAELFDPSGDPVNPQGDDAFVGVLSGKRYRRR